MRLESQVRDGVCVLRLQGRFVTGSDAALVSARKSLEEIGIVKAIVDLGAVPYIDSTGLAFIVELHKSLANGQQNNNTTHHTRNVSTALHREARIPPPLHPRIAE